MNRMLVLSVMIIFIFLSFINCSEDKTTNPTKDPDNYNLISVPATSAYPMGWEGIRDTEEPIHTVSLDEFQIGIFEVSYALWTEVKAWAESNGYIFVHDGQQGGCVDIECNTSEQHPVTYISWRDCIAWCNAYSEKEGLTPVYYVTSEQATVYDNSSTGGDIGNDCVDWAANGFRLPTEAEWEYAARYISDSNVSSGAYPSGYNLNPEWDNCGWYSANSGYSTHQVGQLQENSLGAKDMNGNVCEWCWDWYYYYPSTPQNNPMGPESGVVRVHRGGGWSTLGSSLRTALRGKYIPEGGGASIGFRICRGSQAF